jgi:hypothetical protein
MLQCPVFNLFNGRLQETHTCTKMLRIFFNLQVLSQTVSVTATLTLGAI